MGRVGGTLGRLPYIQVHAIKMGCADMKYI